MNLKFSNFFIIFLLAINMLRIYSHGRPEAPLADKTSWNAKAHCLIQISP